MRIELLEKIVIALAVLAIVLVAGLVSVFSFVTPLSSGISKEEETATLNIEKWLEDARRVASGQAVITGPVAIWTEPAHGGGGVAVTPGGQQPAPAAPKAQPGQQDNYIAHEGETISQQEQVPGIPWLRKQEGVTYMRPEAVPQIVAERYRGFEEAWQAAQQGAGEFVDGKYRINWVDPNSLLATKVGIQQGDQIISVNGHPVGGSFSAGRQLYDSLKGEKHFAVKVLRNGQEVMLSFYVN